MYPESRERSVGVISPRERLTYLAAMAAEKYNALRFNFKNVELLYRLPEGVLPLTKWLFYEFASHISYGQGDMPVTVGIETIAACNRSCPYCVVEKPEFGSSRKTFVMDDVTYEGILSGLRGFRRIGSTHGFNGALFLNGYGEPLLDKKIAARVALARRILPDARIGLFSNGDFLTEETFLGLAQAGVNKVVLTPHDGSFKHEVYEVASRYKELGILQLNKPLEFFSNRGGMINVPRDKLISPTSRCISSTYSFWVAADGTIAMCCNDATLTVPMGIAGQKPLLDTWNSPEYMRTRQALRHGRWDELPEICTKCRVGV
ncbi:MAG: SPASM domain-containing protein [bacterium]|nr:SPASM domain-containing protein [bacterium]